MKKTTLVLAVLQARMSSSRLPGKVLKPILGKPMLERQVERLNRSREIDKLIIATSNNPEDDAIAGLGDKLGIGCFRGDLANVLDRFYRACRPYSADTIVRLTGDCPLTDPAKIDELIRFYRTGPHDYVTNCARPCLPHGLDAEVFSMDALETAWQNAALPSEREHVTPFLKNPENGFSVGHLEYPDTHSHLRWCVDRPEDFDLVKIIFEKLHPANNSFTTSDIIRLMETHPELATLNTGFDRDEGYQKSLVQDRAYLSR